MFRFAQRDSAICEISSSLATGQSRLYDFRSCLTRRGSGQRKPGDGPSSLSDDFGVNLPILVSFKLKMSTAFMCALDKRSCRLSFYSLIKLIRTALLDNLAVLAV